MTGLLRKIYFEVRLPTLMFGIGLAAIMGLLSALLPQILGDADNLLDSIPFIRPLISALLNVNLDGGITGQMMQAFLWVHPTVLALTWAHALMYCSRMPAAEVDRGTIDFLLGLPVSRLKLYTAETLGCVVSGALVLAIGYCGHAVAGSAWEPEMLPPGFATFAVLSNLFAVYLAVAGMTFLVSASSDRRGRAIGIVFGVLLFSFLLNFMVPFWEPAKAVAFLSIMEYYKPALIIEANAFPLRDVSILTGLAAVFWTAGAIVFRQRSICTV